MSNSLEIDFLPVGEESKGGDAIAIRFGLYEDGKWKNQKVIIIDGGNLDSGDALVKHVTEVYKTKKVDRVILTHPDGDHASGLRNVIDDLEIANIWMHRPWKYWDDLKNSIIDNRVTKKSFSERLREAYQFAHDIEQKANEKKIEIFPPHQGSYCHESGEIILTILGPSKELYLNMVKASVKNSFLELIESFSKSATVTKKKFEYENMTFETEHLAEEDSPISAENNMSLIMLLTVADSRVLFTGDAGTQGLSNAIQFSRSMNINLKNLDIFVVPHHGSSHSLSKGILKSINAKYSIISCPKKGEPSHPSAIVTNSLLRRQMNPHWTKGALLNFHHGDAPQREGLSPAEPIPFSNQVEIPINDD